MEVSLKNYNHSMLMKNSSYKQAAKKKKDDRPQDSGLKVYVHHNDIAAVEGAIRRLRKRMDAENVMEDFYKHAFFVKKSTRLRERRRKNQHLAKYKK